MSMKLPDATKVHPLVAMIFYEFRLRDLTYARIEECTGITRSRMGRIKTGVASPSLRELQLIADMLGCEIKLHRTYTP